MIRAAGTYILIGIVSEQKRSKVPPTLTSWEARGRSCEQAKNIGRNHSHSLSEEPRPAIVNRVRYSNAPETYFLGSQGQALSAGQKQTQQGAIITHQLLGQGQALSAGSKQSRAPQHSPSGEPKTGIVSRLESPQGTSATYWLENQGWALSVGWKHSKAPQPLTYWRVKDRHCY